MQAFWRTQVMNSASWDTKYLAIENTNNTKHEISSLHIYYYFILLYGAWDNAVGTVSGKDWTWEVSEVEPR
jgi:hypothetical protein